MADAPPRWIDLLRNAIAKLPPGYLAMIGLTVAFMGLVLWFFDAQAEHRMELIKTLIERCLPSR